MVEKMRDENGQEWEVGYDRDYIPGYDDGEWDPIMGDTDERMETDDEWLDNFWEDEG